MSYLWTSLYNQNDWQIYQAITKSPGPSEVLNSCWLSTNIVTENKQKNKSSNKQNSAYYKQLHAQGNVLEKAKNIELGLKVNFQ